MGLAAIIPDDSIAKLDLVANQKVDSHGWIQKFETKPVKVDAKLTAEVMFYPLVTVNMNLILFPGTFYPFHTLLVRGVVFNIF